MLKVIIIDGNAISRNLLSTIITNGGLLVVGDTNTSSAGLARVIKLQPQIVCVDIGHPDDGMAILDTIRNELPKALIFMVSAKIDSATVQGALQRGVQAFIVKPYNSLTVLAIIRNAIIKLAKQQRVKVDE